MGPDLEQWRQELQRQWAQSGSCSLVKGLDLAGLGGKALESGPGSQGPIRDKACAKTGAQVGAGLGVGTRLGEGLRLPPNPPHLAHLSLWDIRAW